LARKVNNAHQQITEEEGISSDVNRIKNLVEKKLWLIDGLLLTYFVFLTYFEKPFWCSNRGGFMTDDCREDLYGNNYNLLLFFNYHSRYVFALSAGIMAYFNLKHLISYQVLKKAQSFEHSDRKKRLVLVSALSMLHVLFYFLTNDGVTGVDMCSVIRTVFLCIQIELLYANIKRVGSYLINFYEVFLLFFLNWLFVAALVEVLFVAFPTYYDHDSHYSFNFNNYFKTLFSVFVFFTGSNSPDMFMKRFPANGLLTYSFIFLIWVNNVLVTGFLLGLSYYKMKLGMTREIGKVMEKEEKLAVFEKLQEHPEIG
jgi:hypothetical protein